MRIQPKKILVPLTISTAEERAWSDEAVSASIDLAQAFAAELVFLHVSPPPMPWIGADLEGIAAQAVQTALEEQRKVDHGQLEVYVEVAGKAGVKASEMVRTEGDAVPRVICEVAKNEGVELIALPSHGREGIRHVLLGSVAERVAHLADVPVLLLKPPRVDDAEA